MAVTLAIVDDHELVREGLRVLLQSAGHVVVYSGDNTRDSLYAQPQVVLLDVDLGPGQAPVKDRVHWCNEAGSHVLLISAFDDAANIRDGISAGALGFVPKRVSLDELAAALNTVSQGELYLSADLATILSNALARPDLSPRETDALSLYASGLTMNAVARRMGVSPHTAKEYIDRVRAKYAAVGRQARTRTELYAAATKDGVISV